MMMTKYDIDYRKLAVLLLPMCLRRQGIIALVRAFVSPLGTLSENFGDFRSRKNYRLTHNGQTCYLRAVLNDEFDAEQRRITIDDNESTSLALILKRRTVNTLRVPRRGSLLRVYRRGWEVSGDVGFAVHVPIELESRGRELRAVINTYKLASKKYIIVYS